jgi:hypothetical protein
MIDKELAAACVRQWLYTRPRGGIGRTDEGVRLYRLMASTCTER